MRNIFLFLVCLMASMTLNARQTSVEVSTDNTSLIMIVDQVGALRIAYYGVKGLEQSLKYHIEELNVDNSKCADAGHTLTGALLVNRGLEHRMAKKYTSSVFLLTAE